MNAKPMVNLEIKRNELGWLGLCLCGAVLALGQSSCSTAGSAAWSKIQDEGLIPYLAEQSSLAMEESAEGGDDDDTRESSEPPALGCTCN